MDKKLSGRGDMLAVFAQLLLVCFLLIVDGEPFRFFILRRFKLFSNLDVMQICVLNIYLGGMFFYAIGVLPFKLFNYTVILGFTALSLFLSFIVHFDALKGIANMLKVKSSVVRVNRKTFSAYLLVFVMFIIFLVINLFSVASFVFGSVRDESIHSLFVQVILENGNIPLTLQPYLQEGIIYPQAAHVIFAFASYFLSMEIPQVVFYVTILFKALSVVAAYSLGLKLGFDKSSSALLSFVFAFISSWPLFITWGGNPFAVGFPLFLVCLGMLLPLLGSTERYGYAELLALGFIFGYLGAIILSYLQVLMVIALFVLIYYAARKRSASRLLGEFVVIFCTSLLPLSPFLYRFFIFYHYPGHNIGIPSDFMGWTSQQLGITQALQWAFDNLSPYILLRLLILTFLVALVVLIRRTRDYGDVKRTVAFALVIFVSATALSFLSFFLPADFGVVSWGHQGIIMSISINLLIFAFYIKAAKILSNWLKDHLPRVVFYKHLCLSSLLTFTLLSLVTVPFLYYRVVVDPVALQGAYNVYGVTTVDDYNLMLWMKENLSLSAVVLVHPYEAGLFIPSVSHHRIVFPYSGSTFSRRYQTVVGLIENRTMNTTAYDLMRDLGVSHVFVGAQVAYCEGYSIWAPELFLGNPNFKLVKNFGRAYLFELNYTNPNIAFLDDFEHDVWDQSGWQYGSFGNGLGNVTIAAGFGQNGSRCLMLSAQATPAMLYWEPKYVYWVSREIFVLNNSEVALSFYLDARKGFGGNDTFALIISDATIPQSLVITTPNGIYDEFVNAIKLDSNYGTFNVNLSEKWLQVFNSSMPRSFILQLANYDFDGVINTVYIDDIKVICKPIDHT
ncbi:MAG: hypothetical protein QXM65_03275 [Candidatus Bathyarchaeia archaeon]